MRTLLPVASSKTGARLDGHPRHQRYPPEPPTPTPTPTPPLGSCALSDGCSAGSCVPDLSEVDCVLTATTNTCAPLRWSPAVSDCSVPAPNTGCCVIVGLPDSGTVCAGNADGTPFMGLTEAGCQAVCPRLSAVFEQALPECSTVWGYGQDCGDTPYSGCVAVNTPAPTPIPSPTP
jgi:hypothetical protein